MADPVQRAQHRIWAFARVILPSLPGLEWQKLALSPALEVLGYFRVSLTGQGPEDFGKPGMIWPDCVPE